MMTRRDWWLTLVGWLLFTGSAVLFTWASVRMGDMISILASLLFFFACIFSIIPVLRMRPSTS